ncbi:xyloglucan:xyloglucosyl transferase [Marchantia polymorpha subsp. ruderalis]|uniref:Xyloglucan endotransglucosylase/hydrolase n=2 Tax=Marchantia polymorpha TaxID=3197 RepID=A0A176VZC2_MARPO|nr:hypothetical protein AXG93_3776s1030 [Marchantia polymorpha subsp. ruderalis]PTQ27364.1 hypothetical protein MARPO_0203s0013 [Marchantia polymorpha]BBN05105.1 hypothetical protein Mp_3g10340 [Marchantia polymorpha subsp. ruderalis]|eukprot:PTQ27364.1 hypothetical protein MARPO_0203s0013 [Marchantia polymorpha]
MGFHAFTAAVFALSLSLILRGSALAHEKFDDQFNVVWSSSNNILAYDDSKEVELSLTKAGGANFQSSDYFLYGSFSVKLKLIHGESAGTVTAFYLTSFGENHDEIDFEFLGNETGEPYTLHTNLFVNGTGGREQRIKLWFDPTTDFHTYTIIWNHFQILWLVDYIPIRFYRNLEDIYPGSYPHLRPMVVSACLFDASAWATQDGTKPVKWQYAPFVVKYKNFAFEACEVQRDGSTPCDHNYRANWWEGLYYQKLDEERRDQVMWVVSKWKIYDYCYDNKRYPRAPLEPLECNYNVPWVW